MIDTIKLNLVDVSIKKSAQLRVQPGLIDVHSGEIINEHDLFINEQGELIRGSKAYLNDEKFNLTIFPSHEADPDAGYHRLRKKKLLKVFTRDELLEEDFDDNYESNGIFVQASIPRLRSENNFKSLNAADEKQSLIFLEKQLREAGIKCNIWNSELSRIDSFANLKTDYSFYSYTPLFNLMQCSRKKAVEWNGETYLWKNGSQQLMCYDKELEIENKIKRKNKEHKIKFASGNIVRIENRYLKKRKIRDNLELIKLGDLYKNYDVLKDDFKNEISRNIFKYELPDIDLLTNDSIKNEMLIIKNIYSRNWFQKYLMLKGVQSIIKATDINSIFEVFESIESRSGIGMKKSRLKKMISEMKMILPENNQCSYKTNRELYNELKTKFFKEAA